MDRGVKRLFAFLLTASLLIFLLPTLLSWSPALAGRAFSLKLGGSWEISELQLTWQGPQVLGPTDYASDTLRAHFDRLDLHVPLWGLLRSPPRGAAELDNGTFLFPPSSSLHNVSAKIASNNAGSYDVAIAGSTAIDSAPGSFGLTGVLTSLQPLHVDLDASAKRFPGPAVDLLANALGYKLKGLMKELLGDRVDLKASLSFAQNNGSADVTVVSTLAALEFHGNLDGHTLTLKEPLIAWFPLNEILAHSALRDLNPLFLAAIKSKTPVRLQIEPLEASLPYQPFDWNKVKLLEGTLDLGQVICSNTSLLHTLLSVTKNKLPAEELNAWFTPLYFSVQNGVIKTQRLDALIGDSLHICTWGTINLPKDQVRMFLGLPADTLEQVFGIRGLPPSYVLKLPIKGSPAHPRLETSGALAHIAALTAAKKLKHNDFFGGKIGTLAQPDSDTPAPTTQPYPWAR